MSQYYNSQRKSNLYDPNSKESFRISRTKIELFLDCPRCFYLDRRLGVSRPPGFPFSLNNAVDALLKQEFDIHRAQGTKHPLILLCFFLLNTLPKAIKDLREILLKHFYSHSYFQFHL